MANTHDLGRAYWTTSNILDESGPLVSKGWSAETDEPFRMGACLVFRLPRSRYGIAVGWWGHGDQEEATLEKIGVRYLGPITDWDTWDEEAEYYT